MRALCVDRIGGPLRVGTVPDPEPAADEVLVDIAYASVNPLDIWVSRGNIGAAADHLPWVPGTEAAGFVDGRAVLVRGMGLGVTRHGLCAERAAVPAAALLDVADGEDLAHVASIAVAGITAWNALHTKGAVHAGDRVLVLGASGGVGTAAVQLARAAGATVWGHTGSAAKAATVDADHVVVAAGAHDLRDALHDVAPTLVLDPLGGEFTTAAIEALAPGGRIVVYGTSADEHVGYNLRTFYRKGLTMYGYTNIVEPVERQHEVMQHLLAAARAGQLRMPYELVPLEDAAGVHERLLTRSVTGKLVIDCRAQGTT